MLCGCWGPHMYISMYWIAINAGILVRQAPDALCTRAASAASAHVKSVLRGDVQALLWLSYGAGTMPAVRDCHLNDASVQWPERQGLFCLYSCMGGERGRVCSVCARAGLRVTPSSSSVCWLMAGLTLWPLYARVSWGRQIHPEWVWRTFEGCAPDF